MKPLCLVQAGLTGLVICCATALGTPPGITGLGFRPGDMSSQATGISADGTVVTGNSEDPSGHWVAFRWTRSTGIESLGTLPGQPYSHAEGVSGDGTTIVANGFIIGDSPPYHALRWTRDTGMIDLGALTPTSNSYGNCINACGEAIAGETSGRACLWTSATGITTLGPAIPDASTAAYGISGDGSIVVGTRRMVYGPAQAFRWTAQTGMVDLGTLPGGLASNAFAISYDGSTIVGASSGTPGGAFRWTSATGMVSLGTIPGTTSWASGISGDGSTIFGTVRMFAGDQPFIWKAEIGMMYLTDYLQSLGIDFTGWTLGTITGLSADGLCIVGTGFHNDNWQAFLINLDSDTDGDGLYDSWETNGIPYVNCNGTLDRYHLPGANKYRKDIYVEVDCLSGFEPSAHSDPSINAALVAAGLGPTGKSLDLVANAFLNAPVNAPGLLPGIALHILIDETGITPNGDWSQITSSHNEQGCPTIWPDAFDTVKTNHWGSIEERTGADAAGKLAAKRMAFRYCVFARTYEGRESSGLAELPGNDFMVTLGHPNWLRVLQPSEIPIAQTATFMHELGHTLGLHHGGSQEDCNDARRFNFKPNYYSVMNYTWQFPLPLNQVHSDSMREAHRNSWCLDYSEEGLPVLDEAALNEANGIGGEPTKVVKIGPPSRLEFVAMGGPVNWNNSGGSDENGVHRDINWIDGRSGPTGEDSLTGFSDWESQIHYKVDNGPDFADGTHSTATAQEMTAYDLLASGGGNFGDMNCDFAVDGSDIMPFVSALLNPVSYASEFPQCFIRNGDFTGDGSVDAEDISPFVTKLLGQ